MPAGLQIFDENGDCILDLTDSLCRILGSFVADAAYGSFTPPALDAAARVFAYCTYTGRSFHGGSPTVPLCIYIAGQTINWRYRSDNISETKETIFYGTY